MKRKTFIFSEEFDVGSRKRVVNVNEQRTFLIFIFVSACANLVLTNRLLYHVMYHIAQIAKYVTASYPMQENIFPPLFLVSRLTAVLTNRRGNDLIKTCLYFQVLLSQWLAVLIVVIGNGCDARSTRVSAQYTVGDAAEPKRTFGTRGIVEDAVIEDGGILTKPPRPTRVRVMTLNSREEISDKVLYNLFLKIQKI